MIVFTASRYHEFSFVLFLEMFTFTRVNAEVLCEYRYLSWRSPSQY